MGVSGLRVFAGRLCALFVGILGVLLCWLAFMGEAGAALPDGRAYELVSQANTNGAPAIDTFGGVTQFINDDTFWFGGAVTPLESSPSGAEPIYSASRGKSGWSDTSLSMDNLSPYLQDTFVDATRAEVEEGSPVASVWRTANTLLFTTVPPSDQPQGLFYRNSEGNYSLIVSEPANAYGEVLGIQYGGMSANGQTVVYQAPDLGSVSRVYAWHPGGSVQRLSTGALSECGAHTVLGGKNAGGAEAFSTNSVSEDGSTVFMESAEGGPESCPSHTQVYVNHEGVVTLISTPNNEPLPAEAPAAGFLGATPNGQTAYFDTTGNLTGENPTEESDQLYQWNAGQGISCITCKVGISLLSDGSGNFAVSSNGLYVWIVSDQDSSDPEALYLYSDGKLQVASGPPVLSNSVISEGSFAISPSGEEVAIVLKVNNELNGDALYRVSDSTGSLEESCISCVGNVTHPGAVGIQNDQPLKGVPGASTVGGTLEGPLTSNGETVVFTSDAALTSGARETHSGLANVYEWNQERGVSFIAEDSAFGAMISPDGSNIFFTSLQDLVPTATQSSEMLYDARVGGGFPEQGPPATPACVEALSCQGPGAAAASAEVGSGASSAGDGSVASTVPARLGKIVLSRSELALLERGSTATLRLHADGAGIVTLLGKCMFAGRSVECAHASATASGPTLALRLRLSRAARDALAKSARLRLSLTATLPGASAQHASYMLATQASRHRKRRAVKLVAKHRIGPDEVQK